jgi:hypothetical protein
MKLIQIFFFKFSSYLTENTLRLHYKVQSVIRLIQTRCVGKGKNCNVKTDSAYGNYFV